MNMFAVNNVLLRRTRCLIASTAVTHGLPLLTANVKHYRVVKSLAIQKFFS
jgi:predicted nucleic acid-binding protein